MTPRNVVGRTVGRVLRAGSIVAFAAIAVGLAAALVIGSPASRPTPLLSIITRGGPDGLIAAGIGVLALTPAAGLATAAAVLFRDGERGRAAAAVAVLGLLGASVAIGLLTVAS